MQAVVVGMEEDMVENDVRTLLYIYIYMYICGQEAASGFFFGCVLAYMSSALHGTRHIALNFY